MTTKDKINILTMLSVLVTSRSKQDVEKAKKHFRSLNRKRGTKLAAKLISAMCVTIILLAAGGVFEKTYACRKGCSPSSRSIPANNNGYQMTRNYQQRAIVPPQPPGFPYSWFNKDVVKSLNDKDVKIEQTAEVQANDYTPLPAKAKETTKFSIPELRGNTDGFIYSFKKKRNLEKIQKHYLKLNKKGKLHTWSFTKDNILLVLRGDLPREKALLFESALNELGTDEQ